MNKKYKLTMTEKQLDLTSTALEEYFRLRMGQANSFCDDIAMLDVDLSPENQNHDRIFDQFIHRRDHLQEIMRCFYNIACEPYNRPTEKSFNCRLAEDIWEAIRVHRGWQDYPLYLTDEPVVQIEEIEEGET